MWKRVALAACVGFLVSILWMLLGFVLFNAGTGLIADLYYAVARIVCPIFPVTSNYEAYGPFANGALYAFVTGIVLRIRGRS